LINSTSNINNTQLLASDIKLGWPWTTEVDTTIYNGAIFWPKISIVTPSFNQGKFIEATIRSVLAQNYPNLEYIIIDGGSTDETINIIKKYELRISYWISEPDNGQSHAINKGLAKCTGEIFNWLNSDDWLEPLALFEIADRFRKKPSLKVISGFENHISPQGEVSLQKGTTIQESLLQTIELCHITQPSTFFRLDALRGVGAISEDLNYLMDGEMWIRFLMLHGQKDFLKIHKTLVNFRLHDHSKTSMHLYGKFLYERNSIVIDLQRYVGVPDQIIDFWMSNIYRSTEVMKLNRRWILNSKYITSKQLRIYFIKKFINFQFQFKNFAKAEWGIKQLLQNKQFDIFFIKSFFKLFVNWIK
jgi:glycosyltransferase involved in cell wall biosynthesis